MDNTQGSSTPPLDNVPVMQAEIPPEMFLRPINFELARRGQGTGGEGNPYPGATTGPAQQNGEDEDLGEVSFSKSQLGKICLWILIIIHQGFWGRNSRLHNNGNIAYQVQIKTGLLAHGHQIFFLISRICLCWPDWPV